MGKCAKTVSALALAGAILLLVTCPSEPDQHESYEFGEKMFSPNAQRLMDYLAGQYGNTILSGQMDTTWTGNEQMDMIARVYADTGKYPAIKGFDMMELPYSWSSFGRQQIDEAIEWWEGKNNGAVLLPDKPGIRGIVTFCWHWRTGANNQFYTNQTSFRIPPVKDGKLDTESAAFQTVKSDLDKAAALLQVLKDRDIPVLWRPLHEASGGWFWWGASGPSPYIALWEYMYIYLAKTKGLDNLIWVWNGQHREWFPNPASVDIVGYDVYTNASTAQTARDYSSQQQRFNQTRNMAPGGKLMVAMTENGAIPDPDNCKRDGAMWSWFMTWNDSQRDSALDGTDHKDNFWTGQYHNTSAHKQKVYNHDLVLTLDKLPDWE